MIRWQYRLRGLVFAGLSVMGLVAALAGQVVAQSVEPERSPAWQRIYDTSGFGTYGYNRLMRRDNIEDGRASRLYYDAKNALDACDEEAFSEALAGLRDWLVDKWLQISTVSHFGRDISGERGREVFAHVVALRDEAFQIEELIRDLTAVWEEKVDCKPVNLRQLYLTKPRNSITDEIDSSAVLPHKAARVEQAGDTGKEPREKSPRPTDFELTDTGGPVQIVRPLEGTPYRWQIDGTIGPAGVIEGSYATLPVPPVAPTVGEGQSAPVTAGRAWAHLTPSGRHLRGCVQILEDGTELPFYAGVGGTHAKAAANGALDLIVRAHVFSDELAGPDRCGNFQDVMSGRGLPGLHVALYHTESQELWGYARSDAMGFSEFHLMPFADFLVYLLTSPPSIDALPQEAAVVSKIRYAHALPPTPFDPATAQGPYYHQINVAPTHPDYLTVIPSEDIALHEERVITPRALGSAVKTDCPKLETVAAPEFASPEDHRREAEALQREAIDLIQQSAAQHELMRAWLQRAADAEAEGATGLAASYHERAETHRARMEALQTQSEERAARAAEELERVATLLQQQANRTFTSTEIGCSMPRQTLTVKEQRIAIQEQLDQTYGRQTGICGPDITQLVLKSLRDVHRKRWATWSAEKRREACESLITPGLSSSAWDINALAPATMIGIEPESKWTPTPLHKTYQEYKNSVPLYFEKVAGQCAKPRQ